jgi:hypothetical protein
MAPPLPGPPTSNGRTTVASVVATSPALQFAAPTPIPPAPQATAKPARAAPRPMTFVQANVVIFLLLTGLGLPVLGWLRPVPAWDYKIVSPGDLTFDTEMERLGHDGWEVVSARRATSGQYSSASYEMILKRPSNPFTRSR